jgi:hypothetical protein
MVKVIPPAVSQNEKAMQHLLDDPILTCLGSSAPDLIETMNFQVSYTDAQTKKCILGNSKVEYLHKGIETLQSPADLIGLTMDDILEMEYFIPPSLLKRTILKIDIDSVNCARVELNNRLDHEVKMRKLKVQAPFVTILNDDFIYSKLLVKQPVLSRDKRKVIAILTCCYDRTPDLSLLEQFQLHRDIYPDKFAIKVLLKHFKIAHFFRAPPTVRELQVLLEMCYQHPSRKRIGKQFNVSYYTIAAHLQHIKELKLIKPDYYEVLNALHRVPANLSAD